MHNLEPYSSLEEDFLHRCAMLGGTNMMENKSSFVTPEWFKLESPDPNMEMSFRMERNPIEGDREVSKKLNQPLVVIGKATRVIRAPSYKIVHWLWDWTNERRLKLNKEQGEIERGVVEEVNEHHRIVSSTKSIKSLRGLLSPREGVMRFIWKEVRGRGRAGGGHSRLAPRLCYN